MFYCPECARENDWPTEIYIPRSQGPCEVCHRVAICFDIPSRLLPPARPKDAT